MMIFLEKLYNFVMVGLLLFFMLIPHNSPNISETMAGEFLTLQIQSLNIAIAITSLVMILNMYQSLNRSSQSVQLSGTCHKMMVREKPVTCNILLIFSLELAQSVTGQLFSPPFQIGGLIIISEKIFFLNIKYYIDTKLQKQLQGADPSGKFVLVFKSYVPHLQAYYDICIVITNKHGVQKRIGQW